jgi:hypothetical protein
MVTVPRGGTGIPPRDSHALSLVTGRLRSSGQTMRLHGGAALAGVRAASGDWVAVAS